MIVLPMVLSSISKRTSESTNKRFFFAVNFNKNITTLNPLDDQCATVRCVAAELGQALEIECVDETFMKDKAFTDGNQTGNLPMLSTAEGSLQESSAIIKYLCSLSGKLLGSDDYQRSLVDQWFAYVNTTIRKSVN